MQNQEPKKTIQELLQEKLDISAKITTKSLVGTDDLGKALDFSGGVEYFKRTLNLFSKLKINIQTNLIKSHKCLLILFQKEQILRRL